MNLLGGLLSHYQQLFKDKQQENKLIIDVIKKIAGFELKNQELRIKESVLFLKIKSKYKLSVFLQKEKILEEFKIQGIKVIDLK